MEGEEKVEANRKALEFLQSFDFNCISKAIFQDRLALVSEDGKTIGEMKVSVEETIKDEEVCYLVQTHSYSVLDGVPVGSSITGFITRGMKTLDLTQHDYTEVSGKVTEKKVVITYDGCQYVIRKTISSGDNDSEIEKIYPSAAMIGYISDGATIILERIMCIKEDIPETANFIGLDTSLNLVSMTYEKMLDEMFEVDGQHVQTIGIERGTQQEFRPVKVCTRFLIDGHIASQQTVGALNRTQLLVMPLTEKEEDTTVIPEQEDLNWREDMELNSFFIERKEELKSDHQTYLRHKPELQAMLKDFLQFVLLRKPEDVCNFAASYFGSLSSKKVAPTLPSNK